MDSLIQRPAAEETMVLASNNMLPRESSVTEYQPQTNCSECTFGINFVFWLKTHVLAKTYLFSRKKQICPPYIRSKDESITFNLNANFFGINSFVLAEKDISFRNEVSIGAVTELERLSTRLENIMSFSVFRSFFYTSREAERGG